MIDDKENSFSNPGVLKSPDYKSSIIKSPISKENSIIDSSFTEMSEYINKVFSNKYLQEYIIYLDDGSGNGP